MMLIFEVCQLYWMLLADEVCIATSVGGEREREREGERERERERELVTSFTCKSDCYVKCDLDICCTST